MTMMEKRLNANLRAAQREQTVAMRAEQATAWDGEAEGVREIRLLLINGLN